MVCRNVAATVRGFDAGAGASTSRVSLAVCMLVLLALYAFEQYFS